MARQLVHQPQAWQLTSMLPEMFLEADSWQLLYSSADHGQSANRLQHHAFQYRGPTLLVVRTLDHEVGGDGFWIFYPTRVVVVA